MVSIKKVTRDGTTIHVRYRRPAEFGPIRTPAWATRVARSVLDGASVRMGRTPAGTWLVQSVLIPRSRGRSKNDAMRAAGKIRRKIED